MNNEGRGYLTPLRVENIDAKNWRIFDRFGWRGSQDDEFWVEPGETTDFATVPWWSQAITPRTGTWTKAAVLHDKMCNLLNEYYRLLKQYEALIAGWRSLNQLTGLNNPEPAPPEKPVFSSIDTDAIFRKNAREDGTDPVRSELLWLGVRLGALRNPARREHWGRTAFRVVADLVLIAIFLYLCTFVILWIAHSL